MASEGSWLGLLRGCMALALLWWAWAGFAWLTSVIDPEEGSVRIVMFAAMSALVVAALAVPESFGARALTFAVAYGVVRIAHIALFLVPGRDNTTLRHTVLVFAASSAVAIGLLVGASFLDPGPQTALWAVAIVLDFAAALIGIGGWSLMPMHFAERHNLIIILALGESIIALGVGTHVELTTPVTFAVVLGVALASGVVVDLLRRRGDRDRAAPGACPVRPRRNRLARDCYSYMHLIMVTGIVLTAFGVEHVLEHVHDPLAAEYCFALLGGVAIYLLGHVAVRLRSAYTLNVRRLVLASCCSPAIPLATKIDALAALAAVDVLLWAMIADRDTPVRRVALPVAPRRSPEPGAPIGVDRR